jgi:hypothetical protein
MPLEISLISIRGKAIAIRLAEDGFDVCINDVPANQAGIDEVRHFQNTNVYTLEAVNQAKNFFCRP